MLLGEKYRRVSSQFGGKGLLGPESNNQKIKLGELHFIKIKKSTSVNQKTPFRK